MYTIIKLAEYLQALEKSSIPENIKILIDRKITFLAQNPKHRSLEVHEYHMNCDVNGKPTKVWLFYITMKYRVYFVYGKDMKIYIIHVSNHHDVPPRASYSYEILIPNDRDQHST